jgi:hypothetical protein
VLLGALLGAAWWMLHSSAGTAWLLPRIPQLQVVAPQGSLIGDFAAQRLELTLPGTGVLRLDGPRWQALRVARGRDGRWLHIVIDSLHADRVTWLPQAEQSRAAAEPAGPPQSLRLRSSSRCGRPASTSCGSAAPTRCRSAPCAAGSISAPSGARCIDCSNWRRGSIAAAPPDRSTSAPIRRSPSPRAPASTPST